MARIASRTHVEWRSSRSRSRHDGAGPIGSAGSIEDFLCTASQCSSALSRLPRVPLPLLAVSTSPKLAPTCVRRRGSRSRSPQPRALARWISLRIRLASAARLPPRSLLRLGVGLLGAAGFSWVISTQMGLSSAAAGGGAQLSVFDLGWGGWGQELDKILFFHPADCLILLQPSVIGLCEGITTFTRLFSPEDDCEVIESEKHSQIFFQAEQDIWMVLVVEKTKDSESTWRCGALQGILKEAHSLFTMFNGPIRALLDRQPSAELARGHLLTFVTDYLSDFSVSKKLQLPTFRDNLMERGTVQMLTVSREVAL